MAKPADAEVLRGNPQKPPGPSPTDSPTMKPAPSSGINADGINADIPTTWNTRAPGPYGRS